MKIAHFSDTHGLPRKGVPEDADVIVHTGDLFPNKTRGHRDVEPDYQRDWLRKTIADWARWCGNKPFVCVPGNHDFFDGTVALMRRAGIDAYDARELVTVQGVTFAGLPDIPFMGGDWNHERTEPEIAYRFDRVLSHKPDVLVCHCPIYGILDQPHRHADYHIGSTAIANALTYGDHEPKAYLHGHCHEATGEARIRNTLVSNAATTRRVVTLP